MQEGQRLVAVVIRYLEKANAPGAVDFKRLAASMLNTDSHFKLPISRQADSSKSTSSPSVSRKQIQPQLYRHVSMSESDLLSQQEKLRRATLPNIALQHPGIPQYGRPSMDANRCESPMMKREYRGSGSQLPSMVKTHVNKDPKPPNLDYLSLNNTPVSSEPQSPVQTRPRQTMQNSQHPQNQTFSTSAYNGPKTSTATPTEWEVLLGSFDDRHLYDAIYGGGPTPALAVTDSSNYGSWSPESWDYASVGMGDFNNNVATANSVLSFSEVSLSSDDLPGNDLGLSGTRLDCKRQLLPGTVSSNDGYPYLLEGLDSSLGL